MQIPPLVFGVIYNGRIAISSRKLTSTVANEADAIIVYEIEIKIILISLRLGENVITYLCLNLSESQRYVSSKLQVCTYLPCLMEG